MSMPLFDTEDHAPAQAARLAPKLRALAGRGIYLGTSSWKYEGWLGSIYSPDRYLTRGRFSTRKFEEECLAEYARTFPCVCGDFAFYQFPTDEYWARLFAATPDDFLFAFKVPEDITVPRWPTHARYGTRGGRENEGFLRADLFTEFFASRLEPYGDRVATLIFEFGTFNKSTFPTPGHFYERLEPFLFALPGGFRYAIEIRNPEYLGDGYFELLSSYNVAHCFNAWTRMPTIADQLAMPGSVTADFTVARALLPRGRAYEQAVAALEPYEKVKEPNPEVRSALADLAREATPIRPTYEFINNRLEGNAPTTIEAVAESLGE
jgi:uncharacterized protein YecE (DUF72 family)